MSSARYEVLSKIAEGGLGSVYKAYDRNLHREVAIKRVKAETPEQAEKQAVELLAEAKTLSTLQHPHIVTIFDVGTDENGNFIVMELLKGETLEDIVERGALNDDDFAILVQQSLEGMIAAHDSGLIHLDIKPQNFMVIWLPSGKFQIKILDFGLAKISQHPFYQDTAEDGTILGSIYFMAPEQFEREPVDVRTDLYSLGCAYYFALTQHYPFQGETAAEVMGSHLYHSLVPLSDLRPDLPSFIHRWVEWLMARKSDTRPKSAQEAWDTFKSREFPFEKLVAKAAAPPPSHIRPPSKSQPLHQPTQSLYRPSQPLRQSQPLKNTQSLRHTQSMRLDPSNTKVAGYTQALQNKVFPRPVAGPVNVSSAEAPDHLQGAFSKVSGLKILLIVVSLLLIASVGGTVFFLQQRQKARFQYLSTASTPTGTYDDVKLLVKFLDRPETTEAARDTLIKLQGVNPEYLQASTLFPELDSPEGIGALAKVIEARKLNATVPVVLQQFVRVNTSEARSQLWSAIGTLATAEDVRTILSQMNIASPEERHAAANAIRKILSLDPDPSLLASALIDLSQDTAKNEETRATAVECLGLTGHPKALEEITKLLKDSSAKLRGAAAITAGFWPNGAPLESIQLLIGSEFQPAARLSAIESFTKLLAKSGPFSQDKALAALENVYTNAREPVEENLLLPAAASAVSKQTTAFLKVLREQKKEFDTVLRETAKTLESRLKAVQKASQDETLIQAAKTERLSEGLSVEAPWITQWNNHEATWLIDFERPGKYQVQMSYSNPSSAKIPVVVNLGSSLFRATADPSSASSSPSSLTLGTVQIPEKGTFRLSLFIPQNEGNSQNFKLGDWTLIRLGD